MEQKETIHGEIGYPDYVNQDCWLTKVLNNPPSKRCQYCQLKFHSCLFFQYLIISLILVSFLLAAVFLIEGKISKLVIVAIFILAIIYGYFFNKSAEKIIEANFTQKKAREALLEAFFLQNKAKRALEELTGQLGRPNPSGDRRRRL